MKTKLIKRVIMACNELRGLLKFVWKITCVLLFSGVSAFGQTEAVFNQPGVGQNHYLVENLDYVASKAMAFDSKNRPYIFSGIGGGEIRTLRNGVWHKFSVAGLFAAQFGTNFGRIEHSFRNDYTTINIDKKDNLYLCVRARVGGRAQGYLIFAKNVATGVFGDTFVIKDIIRSRGLYYLEQNNGANNQNYPPSVVIQAYQQGFSSPRGDGANQLNRVSLAVLDYTNDGDIELVTVKQIGDRCTNFCFHSGGHNISVSRGENIYAVFNRTDDNPNDRDGNNVHYIRRYSRTTGLLSDTIRLCVAHPSYADSHSSPVIAVDDSDDLHIMSGGHGSTLTYFKIPDFSNRSSWVENTIGAGRTYPELLIDSQNNMFSAFRASGGVYFQKTTVTNGFSGSSNGFKLARQLACSNYSGYYHNLLKDNNDRIFATWSVLCRIEGNNYANDGARVIAYTDDLGDNWSIPNRYDFLGRIVDGKQVQRINPNLKTDYISSSLSSAITLSPTSNVNLTVNIEVISGPATLNGNVLTLTGEAGDVRLKFFNSGNEQYYGDEIYETIKIEENSFNDYGGLGYSDIASGDFDNDGIDEVAVVRADGGSPLDLRQNRIVMFEGKRLLKNWHKENFPNFHAIAAGNLNTDASDEIVVLTENSNRVKKRILVLDANGRILHDWESGGVHFHDITVGDFDADGIDEIAVTREQGGSPWSRIVNRINLYEANGTFITSWTVGSNNIFEICAGNFNRDSRDEIAVLSRNNVKITTKQNGTILQNWSYGGVWFSHFTTGDFDGDNIDEIVGVKKIGGSPWSNTYARLITFEADGSKTDEWVLGDQNILGITAGNLDGVATEELAMYRWGTYANNRIYYSQAHWGSAAQARSARIHEETLDLLIYPNPVGNKLYFSDCLQKKSTLEIYSVYGKLVSKMTVYNEYEKMVDISFLETGVYVVKGIAANGTWFCQRIIKK
ncbi:T9SS type A sorting domain-containing protein [Prolixibacteraceae bacterium JC049]|nr:T9SS type A sorting domain-containing protein [Prolixibacteraceae bacterium JC049]